MLKKRFFISIFALVLLVSFTGCAALQRKFTRKKKKEEGRIVPVITTYDYSKDLRVEELYKKRFLFWKTWHSELIDRMDAGHKKRNACFDNTLENMIEMRKYLASPKAEELDPYIKKMTDIDKDIKEDRLTKSEKYNIRQSLEKIKRQINKNFSFSDVEGFLELRKENDN